jgi:type I restriction enzyme R subunit
MVLDFANEADDIRKAFEDYYDATILSEETDPNLLYDVQRRLLDAEVFDEDEVQGFAEVYFGGGQTGQDRLYEVLDPVGDRYKELSPEERGSFKHELGRFTRLYAFLAQVMPFEDADLEKLYWFAYWLDRKLESPKETLPVEVQKLIDIDSLRIQETSSGRIELERGEGELRPIVGGVDVPIPEEDLEPLSQIIRELNERFGTDFKDEDRVFVDELLERLSTDAALEASVRANTPENARLTFDHVVSDRLQDMVETNFEFYKRVNDDERFAGFFLDRLFEMYRKRVEESPPGPRIPAVVQKAVDILAREMRPKKIILFGSAARGEADEESDLDFLVVLDEVNGRFKAMRRASELLAPLRVPTDVLVYSTAEVEEWGDVVNHIINEALIDGRVVYDAA